MKEEFSKLKIVYLPISTFGMIDPIGVWGEGNIIVEGHGRLLALKELGYKEVPCIRLDQLTDEQRRGYTLAHNRTAELSAWDDLLLKSELSELENSSIDMESLGFRNMKEDKTYDEFNDLSLADRFIAPPFTIVDRLKGYWYKRLNHWKEQGIDNDIADPVIFELLCKWFCPDGGTVGYNSNMDIHSNVYKNVSRHMGNTFVDLDDSTGVDIILLEPIAEGLDYDYFLRLYMDVISSACSSLLEDRFAVVIARNPIISGVYRDLISDTKDAFIGKGIKLYNELILVDPLGDTSNIDKDFVNRLIHTIHYNILVFYKGNIKAIKDNFKPIGVDEAVTT